jgi:hypothetical protein
MWTKIEAGHYTSGPWVIQMDDWHISKTPNWSLYKDGEFVRRSFTLSSAKKWAAKLTAEQTERVGA